jgi:hypothetical protein
MSTSNQRKAKRRKADPIDFQAIQEGTAIERKFEIGVVHTPMLRHTYRCDGYVFCTGNKYRYGGGMRFNPLQEGKYRPIAKPIQRRNSKQRNIRSEIAHKQTEQPQLLKQLDIRYVQHLVEYQTRLVRPQDKIE